MWDNPEWLNRFAAVLIFLSVVTFLVAGWHYAGCIPVFAVRRFVIQGDTNHVTQQQAVELIALYFHGNFFSVDLDQLRAGFERLPWVRVVSLRRQWPLAIIAEIQEYHPLARWGDSELLTAAGNLFSGATAQSLPVLWGPSGTQRDVLQYYRDFSKILQSLSLRPTMVNLSERGSWCIELSNQIRIQLGRPTEQLSVLQKLQRFVLAYPMLLVQLRAEKKHILSVDLRYLDGFSVKLT